MLNFDEKPVREGPKLRASEFDSPLERNIHERSLMTRVVRAADFWEALVVQASHCQHVNACRNSKTIEAFVSN